MTGARGADAPVPNRTFGCQGARRRSDWFHEQVLSPGYCPVTAEDEPAFVDLHEEVVLWWDGAVLRVARRRQGQACRRSWGRWRRRARHEFSPGGVASSPVDLAMVGHVESSPARSVDAQPLVQ